MSDPREPTPYAPPASMLSEPPLDPSERAASLGRRFVNLLLDQFAIGVITAISGALDPDKTLNGILGESIVIPFLYYAILEAAFGWTFGKLATGTRVVAADGGRASPGQVIGRTAVRFIPLLDALSFLFSGQSPAGWHDTFSGTRVIRIR